MTKQVTVNIFDVEWDEKRGTQKLSDTLDEFSQLPLDQRWRDDIRLEGVETQEIVNFKVYKLDFVKRREVGPGRLANGTAIKAIKMALDEDFGEETAAFYVPKKKWLLVLHNHAGVGPSRMMAYCNALDPGVADRHFDYAALPKLDAAVLQKLNGLKGITSVSVTATMDALTAAEAQSGTSLAQASRAVKSKRISIQLLANDSRKKGSFLDGLPIRSLIDGLLKGGDDVTKLQVSGESHDVGGKDTVIDLLHHKIKRKFSADDLRIEEHRYTLSSRWDLLHRAFRGWLPTI